VEDFQTSSGGNHENGILAKHPRLALSISKQYLTSTAAGDFANVPHLQMWGSIRLSLVSNDKCGDTDSLLLLLQILAQARDLAHATVQCDLRTDLNWIILLIQLNKGL